MCYIPDAYDMWCEHDAQQEEELRKRPKCDVCGEYIQEEHCYRIEGVVICEYCMADNFRIKTSDLMD